MNETIQCLLAKRKSIKIYLENEYSTNPTIKLKNNFSDWKYYTVENLQGRLEEIENILSMLRVEY